MSKLEVLVEHGCSMDNETEIEIDQWRVANNYTLHMFAHLLVIDNNIFQSMQCFDTRAWMPVSVFSFSCSVAGEVWCLLTGRWMERDSALFRSS